MVVALYIYVFKACSGFFFTIGNARLSLILPFNNARSHQNMKHFPICLLACLTLTHAGFSQTQPNLAERLGYPATAKLLIVHSDDLAVAHAENVASIKAMQQGNVNSASVMIPCPWLPEIADYAKKNPNHDLGLHLTLTSEWLPYKWGPVASRSEVASLVDSNGYFYHNCAAFASKAKPEEVARELRAQVEKSKAMGLEPTHFDSHMGCLFFQSPDFFAVYLQLGRTYKVPSMVGRDVLRSLPDAFQRLVTDQDIIVDRILTAEPADYSAGMAQYYTQTLRELEPGVNVLLIHTAYENDEMTGMTDGFPGAWDAGWRQDDYDFFTSDACKQLIRKEGIQLITWKEIGALLKK